MKKAVLCLVIGLAVTFTSGCVKVKVYQRGALSNPIMSFNAADDFSGTMEGAVFTMGFNEFSLIYAGGSQANSGGGCPFCK